MSKRLAGRAGYPKDEPFRPTFHKNRLNEPIMVKKPSKIFVCSMGELWGPWVRPTWRYLTLEAIEKASWHTFLNLTKNPEGINDYQYKSANFIRHLPDNMWVGVSVDAGSIFGGVRHYQVVEQRGC